MRLVSVHFGSIVFSMQVRLLFYIKPVSKFTCQINTSQVLLPQEKTKGNAKNNSSIFLPLNLVVYVCE